jgi:hypothetical protein
MTSAFFVCRYACGKHSTSYKMRAQTPQPLFLVVAREEPGVNSLALVTQRFRVFYRENKAPKRNRPKYSQS